METQTGTPAERPLVLLAENSLEVSSFLQTALRRAGFRTVQSFTSDEAIADVRRLHPDLVLPDVGFRADDGMALAARLKSDAATRHIPVIAFSGVNDPELARRAASAGITTVLLKPCSPQDLLDAVRSALTTARDRLARADVTLRESVDQHETSVRRVAEHRTARSQAEQTARACQECELLAAGVARAADRVAELGAKMPVSPDVLRDRVAALSVALALVDGARAHAGQPHSAGALRQRLARLDEQRAPLLTAIGGAFLLTDEEGRIIDVNPAACSLLNSTQRRLIGTLFTWFLPAEREEFLTELRARAMQGGSSTWSFTVRPRDRRICAVDAALRWMPVDGDPRGRVIWLLSARD